MSQYTKSESQRKISNPKKVLQIANLVKPSERGLRMRILITIIPEQEPITWGEQLPCTRVTVFLQTSLFLERFWRKFRISIKSHKPAVSKAYSPKK